MYKCIYIYMYMLAIAGQAAGLCLRILKGTMGLTQGKKFDFFAIKRIFFIFDFLQNFHGQSQLNHKEIFVFA